MSSDRRIVLVRHSLPEIDPSVPAREWHLSDEGRARSLSLAKRLAAYDLDVLVSSVEAKAVETAQIVARHLNLPFEIVAGLQEHDRSNVVGLDRAGFHRAVARLFAHPNEPVFGAETAAQAGQRFVSALHGVLEQHPDANVAAVTHGTVLSLYLAATVGLDAHALWQQLGQPCFAVLSLPERCLTEIVHL